MFKSFILLIILNIYTLNSDGGCDYLRKCQFGKNYCNECSTEGNLCKNCENEYFPDVYILIIVKYLKKIYVLNVKKNKL
jgi:hypothetical protein